MINWETYYSLHSTETWFILGIVCGIGITILAYKIWNIILIVTDKYEEKKNGNKKNENIHS